MEGRGWREGLEAHVGEFGPGALEVHELLGPRVEPADEVDDGDVEDGDGVADIINNKQVVRNQTFALATTHSVRPFDYSVSDSRVVFTPAPTP